MKKLFVLLLPILSLACAGAPPDDSKDDEALAADDTPGGPDEETDDAEPEVVGQTSQASTSSRCGTDVFQSGSETVGSITYYGFIVNYTNCGSSPVRRKVKGYPLSGKCKTIRPNERVMLKAFTSPWYIYKGVVSC